MSPSNDDPIAFATTQDSSGDRLVRRTSTGGSASDAPPAFREGDMVALRYRIVRFLERGGMGEVYEAEDTLLAMKVAIKCIAAELAADPRMMTRLKREVLLARKVTHRSVCRLYDVGLHGGAHGTVAFLTMDLLHGETLAARIAKRGPLSSDEARPFAHQMADALVAAHEAGVIHRDFKSRNVMIVPDGPSKERAVVMDFGIACAVENEEHHGDDSGEARFIGTPAYMAPEQVSGGAVTVATDVYAFGIVLYEMVTGRLPFESTRAFTAITMRLTDPPVPPRTHVPSLDRITNDVILRCLERDPKDRFATAREAGDALTPRSPARRRRAMAIAALAGAVAAGSVGLVVARVHAPDHAAPIASIETAREAGRRPTIGVLELRDPSGRPETSWLGTAFGEMLSTELAAGEQVHVVPQETVLRARRDLGLGGELSADALARMRDAIGVDYVVTGAYVVESGQVRLDLSLRDASSGATLMKLASSGSQESLFDVVAKAGTGLRRKLGVREASTEQAIQMRAAADMNEPALRLYAQGQDALRAYDYRAARDLLARAVEAQPAHPMLHAALSRAWGLLGFDARAASEARRAFDASRDLPREQQLVVEARYRVAAKEWDRAVEIYRTIFGFFPDNVDYGLDYAATLIGAGRPAEAMRVVDALHALPPPAGQSARIDLKEAAVASKLSDNARRMAAAKTALTKADAMHSMVAAVARMELGEAMQVAGEAKAAEELFEAGRAAFVASGDRNGEAHALTQLANLAADRGDAARALALHEDALRIFQATGDEYRIARVRNAIGIARYGLGQIREARADWEESRAQFEAVGNREGVGHAIGNIGVTYQDEGDVAHAKESYEASLKILSELGMRAGMLDEEGNLADLAILTASFGDARKHEEAATALARAIGGKPYLGRTSGTRAARLRHEGDAVGALRAAEESLTLLRESGAEGFAAEAETLLAQLSLDAGRPAEAAERARRSAEVLEKQGASPAQASALATLAIALAMQDKADESIAIADRAAALAASTPKLAARLDAALAIGASRAAAGKTDDATSALREAREAAAVHGFVTYVREMELALARLAPAKERRALLDRVVAEGRAQGLGRVVRLAIAAQ